ncbi:MAG: SHOCT domain-containing protein [Pseudomonadota bacterium]
MMLGFLALIVLVVVLVVRCLGPSADRTGSDQESAALGVLREQFARGEIDKTEFEERRKVIHR